MDLQKAILQGEIKKTGDSYSFVMSDETIDRDGEVIKVGGWDLKNYKKNNVLMWGHRHDIPAIGTVGRVVKRDGKLIAENVKFASPGVYDLADTVRGLVDDGVLKATSVGYIAKEREFPSDDDKGKKKKPRVITTKAELYELSIVNVGANANALRELKSLEEKAVENGEDKSAEMMYADILEHEAITNPDIDEKDEIAVGEAEKPYANEHACRLKPPDYEKYARQNCKVKVDGKCIDFIFGIKGGKSELQAMRFPKKVWTESAARSYCEGKGGSFEAAKKGWEEIYFQFKGLDEVEQKEFLEKLSIDFCKEIIEDSKEGKYSKLLAGSKDETPAEKRRRKIAGLPIRGNKSILDL